MTESQQLLAEYARNGSETAFRELATRYLGLVHSAALRLVGNDAQLAEDVSQMVFTDLAKKARTLSSEVMLGGWLHQHACFVAAKAMRGERRRQAREREAAEMNLIQEDALFSRIAPILDQAINELAEPDRKAILLRFFEQHDFRKIGQIMGSSEDAARMRVTRALDKLETILKGRGITSTGAALSYALSAHATQAVPAGLALKISNAALTGITLGSATITTVTKTIAMTTLQKTLVVAGLALAAGLGIHQARQVSTARAEVEALQFQHAPLEKAFQELTREHDEATRQLATLREENQRLSRSTAELTRLRDEVSRLQRLQPAEGRTVPGATTSTTPSSKEIGRELGMAVVRGEAGALEKVVAMARAEFASFNKESKGLDDTRRGELSSRTFAPLSEAFKVISDAANAGNSVAADAMVRALDIPELNGNAVYCLGALAGNGNEDALELLLSGEKNGFLLPSVVGALRPAAEKGNQRAVALLADVTKNAKNRVLWCMAASGLEKAAAAGNSVAIDALVDLSATTNLNASVRNAVVRGLRGAAANQSVKAEQALSLMGVH